MLNPYKEVSPIPTVYKGIAFRSRLEARWAVFFDELDIKWEYESERFDFDNNLVYIPDFKLMNSNPLYLEIKPAVVDSSAFRKASKLARTKKVKVYLCVGSFWDKYEIWEFNEDGVLSFDYSFKRCKKCDTIWLLKNSNNACPACGEDMRVYSLGMNLKPRLYKFREG